MSRTPRRLLVIAGSDSGGGAGIQADIKTADAFAVYAMTAITAVTAQDTRAVRAIHPVPARIVAAQIEACLSDIGADAIKIGMLGSAAIVRAVAAALERHARNIPIVLDPVMVSTSGTALLSPAAVAALTRHLLPLATLVTPNLPEARALAGLRGSSGKAMEAAGRKLMTMGAGAALIKGGHASATGAQVPGGKATYLTTRAQPRPGGCARKVAPNQESGAAQRFQQNARRSSHATLDDVLVWNGGVEVLGFPRIRTRHTHGTGCTYASAIACGLAEGLSLPLAVGRAREYVQGAIETAPGLGKGHGPLNHFVRP